jgi:hypothetical protein
VFKVECCIDFGDRIGGYAVPVATASGSVQAAQWLLVGWPSPLLVKLRLCALV